MRKDSDQSERESGEREAGQEVKGAEFIYSSRWTNGFTFKNFLCQERAPHTNRRQGLCKKIYRKMKQCQFLKILLWYPPSTTEHAAFFFAKPPLKSFDLRASSMEEKVQTE